MKLKVFSYKIKQTVIRLLNILIPKKENQIYLRSHYEYRDNIHAILDELLKRSKQHYVIYGDGVVFKEYVSNGVRYVKPGSLKSLLAFLRSKYVFNDGGMFLNTKPLKSQIIVNSWHGVSLKKIGYYLKGYNNDSYEPTSTFVVTYSEFFADVMSKAFAVNRNNVLLTGEPRNDYFFRPVSPNPLMSIGIDKEKFRYVVIWMPTYRQNSVDSTSDGALYEYGIPLINSSNLNTLNEFCKTNNILLIIKWHGLQSNEKGKGLVFSNVRFLTSKDIGEARISLNEIVGQCDCLITDYSSVYVNYLVLNKPICFAYDDIEEYKKNRGFMFENVESIMPGYHTNTFNGLMAFLTDFSLGNDLYVDDRKRVNDLLNKYSDGNNSKRLLMELGLI